MAKEFREFIGYIYETTNCRLPVELEESFKDVFIYVPEVKILTINQEPLIPLEKYFVRWNEDFYNLVYNANWKILENIVGYEFLRYSLVHCIFARKTKTGGFMVSSLSESRNKLTTIKREKLNGIFYKSALWQRSGKENGNDKSAMEDDDSLDWCEVQRNFFHLFHLPHIGISCDDCLFKTSKTRRFPKDHILMQKNNKISLSEQVVQTQVGLGRITGYENCIEPLEKILQALKENHANYSYERSLKHLLLKDTTQKNKKNNKNNEILKNELPISVLKQYFANICYHVIPVPLLQGNKNISTMIKIVCDLLDAPYRQLINLRPYIMKIRLSDLYWLDKATNDDARVTLFAKLLKWLFVTFILEIFRTQFYIMTTTTSKKIFFKQSDWQQSTATFVREMCKDNVIANVKGIFVKGPCVGRWTLIPKKNGVRPIMAPVKGSRMNELTKQTLLYLQQLYTTKYGDFRKAVFAQRWKDFIEKYREGDKKPVYVVSCDIKSAYESIDQKKLIEIVESFADLTDPIIELKSYKIAKDLKALKSRPVTTRKFVSYPRLELPIPTDAVFACVSEKPTEICKESLLREMRSNVTNQNIRILQQRYLLQKGIAQGAILSSILCDMYYAHMIETKLSRFKNQSFLYRYVDDFLFVTEDKALAEEFLEIVKTGFPDYNCTFTVDKTRTNLPGHVNTVKNITYLGYNINLDNLEVTSDYSKNSRYTTLASRPPNNLLTKFRMRLNNLASLKLDGLVLDLTVNSENTIVKTIERAFIRQAERCLWLLRSMFDDIHKHAREILKIIRSNNIQIFRRVKQNCIVNRYDFEKLVPRLALLPWKSYRQVFGKMQSIHGHFRILFLLNIKMVSKVLKSC